MRQSTGLDGVEREDDLDGRTPFFTRVRYHFAPLCESDTTAICVTASAHGVAFSGYSITEPLSKWQTVLRWCAAHVESLAAGNGPIEQSECEQYTNK